METVLLVGAAPYRLNERSVAFLLEWIRHSCSNDKGEPLDDACRAALELAAEIEASADEPLELGKTAIEGLCTYVLRDYLVHGDEEMTAFYYALRRYRGDPV